MQEVLRNQLIDIDCALKDVHSDWSYVGVGHDEGKEAREYSPIFYRSDTWELKTSHTL